MTVKLFSAPQTPEDDAAAKPNQPVVGPICRPAIREEAECPQCSREMRLWAGFYRCRNCGYKESCCF